MFRRTLIAVAAATALAAPAAASAATTNSFDGSCVFGNVNAYALSGQCAGSLNGGASQTYAPVNLNLSENGVVLDTPVLGSISAGLPIFQTGTGKLTFLGHPTSTTIGFNVIQAGFGYVFTGDGSGAGTGVLDQINELNGYQINANFDTITG